MARINIEVDEGTKRKWMRFVDDRDDYSSLTHLINLAVTHEIQEKEGARPRGRGGSGSTSGVPSTDLDGVGEQMSAMRQAIDDLRDDIDRLEMSGQADLTEERVKQLMHAAIGYLPAIDLGQDLMPLGQISVSNPKKRARTSGTVEDISAALEIDTYDAERILARLERDMPHVKATRENGVRRYYQEK